MTRESMPPVAWNWKRRQPVCFVDFETQSNADLKKLGVWGYIGDKSTRIISAVFKVRGRRPLVWVLRPPKGLTYPGLVTGSAVPDEVKRLAESHTWVAHNAEGFDSLVWATMFPAIRPRWQDTQILARCLGLPGSLDKLSRWFGGTGKTEAGSRAMKIITSKAGIVGTLPLWKTLLEYNVKDVEMLETIYDHVAPALVHHAKTLAAHSAVNDRGVLVDRRLAQELTDLWEKSKNDARDEIAELTGGKLHVDNIRSGPSVHAWLRSQGLHLETLRRDEVNLLLDDPSTLEGCDDAELVRAVLTLRSHVTRTAESKLERLLSSTETGNRLRYWATYHAAATGRWASRGVQLHNLPRGGSLDVEATLRSLTLTALGDNVAESLNTLTRPAFMAAEGKTLGIMDYSAVEARGLAWLCQEDRLLERFAAGDDVYLDMASGLFGREVTKADKTERQVGKVVVLGCIAEGTPILTSNGWKPIQTVDRFDLVWDGVEWVTHDGVINKGEKPVINVNGVWMTPDHKILTSRGWVEAWQVQEDTHNSPSVHVEENGQLSLLDPSSLDADAPVVQSPTSLSSTFNEGCQPDVTPVLNVRQERRKSSISAMWRHAQTYPSESVYSTGFPLSNLDALTLSTKGIVTTVDEVSQSIVRGGSSDPSSLGISCHYVATITRRLRLIASTIAGITNRVTSDSPQGRSNAKTVARTYDILNAGPRRRFQAGLLIAHNCGYSMGGKAFEVYCRGQRIDLARLNLTGDGCVKAYRERYPAIPLLWKQYEDAAFLALRTRGEAFAGRCRFHCDGDALVVTLPSGRPIYYQRARIDKIVPMWARLWRRPVPPRDAILYSHPQGFEKTLYGGLLTENITQAVCRDLLAESLVRWEAAGLSTVVHVHDELVYEGLPDDLDRAADLMSRPPKWAKGFPIGVEGFTCTRYVKQPWEGSKHVKR